MMGRILHSTIWFFRRDRYEQEMKREFLFHIECEVEANIARGLEPEEARRQALIRFGGLEQTTEECRDVRRFRFVEDLIQDVRFAVRVLLRSPGYLVIALLTLALGIGANTAIFSVIYGVLLKPLPYNNGDRLVVMRQHSRLDEANSLGFSVKEINDLTERAGSLSGLAEQHSMSFILYGGGEPERIQAGVVSSNFFSVMGVRPLLGRDFLPADEKHGAEAVLILSYDYWQKSHHGDTEIVGKVFSMNDRQHTVIGVLPHIPQHPNENDVYMPTSACPTRSSEQFVANRGARMMNVFARLNDDAPLEQAQAELSAINGSFHAEHPEAYPDNGSYEIGASSLKDVLTKEARLTFIILLITAGLVLLIACANVANLALAGIMRREREMALRNALGAGRGRLIRQLLTESTLLSLAGGVLGITLAVYAHALLVEFSALFTPRAGEISIDWMVLGFALLLSVVTGLAFGLVPALTTRDSLDGAIKDSGGNVTGGASRKRLRNGLVIAQVALAFILLIGAGLMVRSLIKLQQVNPGFSPESVLVMRLSPNWSKYTTAEQYKNFSIRLLERLHGQPGILTAAMASNYPLNPLGIANGPYNRNFLIKGRPPVRGETGPQGDYRVVSNGYFRTLQLPLIAGRFFNDMDHERNRAVAIVNKTLASRYWPDRDAVGGRISYDGGENWIEVIGVVGDARQYGLDREVEGEVYRPIEQAGGAGFLLVRTLSEPESLVGQLRNTVYQLDGETAIDQARTLVDLRSESLASPRLTTILLSLFGVLALVITAAGISGVMALTVSQRTHEMGIRIALGASCDGLLMMIVRQGMALVLIGLGIGIVGALLLNRLMNNLLFSVEPTDPLTFLSVSLVLAMTAAISCYLPARRVTRIDPIISLRYE